MNKYKIVFKDGRIIFDQAKKAIEIIRKYDLSSKDKLGYVLYQL